MLGVSFVQGDKKRIIVAICEIIVEFPGKHTKCVVREENVR